jgi:hypothetical protein
LRLFLGGGRFTLDDVRHYRYPWALRTTIESYAGADLFARVRGLLWLEQALNQAPTVDELHSEAWTSSEVLFALRDAQLKLHRQSAQKSRISRAQ